MVGFAHLWKADKLSDVDVAIRLDGSADDILVIPAHQAILSSSPYFWAQVERWTADGAEAPAVGAGRRAKRARVSNSSSPVDPDPPKRLRLQLVLNSHEAVSAADQAAAAESVLAAMYDPTGSSNLAALDKLTDTQLLQAAIIADMLQLEDTSTQAAGLLAKPTQLSAAVKQQYMSLPAWPQQLLPLFPVMAAGHPLVEVVSSWVRNCASAAGGSPLQGPSHWLISQLLQLPLALEMQAVLVQQLGELDRVWADAQLSQLLLQLPLPAMVLLLSSIEIKVSCEDNVLYTAQAWLDRQPADRQAAAAQCLAPCIRCLQLSKLWLSARMLPAKEAAADDDEEESEEREGQGEEQGEGQGPEDADQQGQGSEGGEGKETREGEVGDRAGTGEAEDADDESWVLQPVKPSIQHYLRLTLFGAFTPKQVSEHAPELKTDCPWWFLPPRKYTPLPGGHVELQWSLPVSQIRDGSERAHAAGVEKEIDSESVTPPKRGVRWRLSLAFEDGNGSGTTVGMFASPINVPAHMYIRFNFTIRAGEARTAHKSPPLDGASSWGCPDYFEVGPTRACR